ncbi:hypothetical protein MKX03_008216 [Papaver bracteatum]|nr:hypothetical protein MKX03_008216 [Papaver bracteatum]
MFISTGAADLTIQYVRNSIHVLHIHDIHSGSGGLIGDSFDRYGLSVFGSSMFGSVITPCQLQGWISVTKRDYTTEDQWMQWAWRSQNDLLINFAFFVGSGDITPTLPYSKQDFISSKAGTFVTRLTRFAGAINCGVVNLAKKLLFQQFTKNTHLY